MFTTPKYYGTREYDLVLTLLKSVAKQRGVVGKVVQHRLGSRGLLF